MHKSQTGEDFWNRNKNIIINKYNNGESLSDIAKEYHCYGSTIGYKLKEWGIPRHERYNNIYNINSEYFNNINTEHKAYWYGLLLSDGHVNCNAITISIRERYILDEFRKDLDTNIPIRENYYKLPTLTIANKHMCNSLNTKGFNHQKSKYIDINKVKNFIPDNLENHFIRGMFDGDGSIKYYKYDYQDTIMLHFGYTGTEEVVAYIKDKFDIKNKIVQEGKYTQTVVSSNPNKIKEIYHYLYRDATIWINRKRNTFEDIFKIRGIEYEK